MDKLTSDTGLCDGSDKCGGSEPELALGGTFARPLNSFFITLLSSTLSRTLGDGISFISHSVAASFLADTAGPAEALGGGYFGDAAIRTDDAGDLDPTSLHDGAGVLDRDPPLGFPIRIALLNL